MLYTLSNPLRPADLAWWDDGDSQQVTQLNEDALGHKQLAQVEEPEASVYLPSEHSMHSEAPV